MNRPFIIVSPGRSGSSYVAKQLHDAGVWGGKLIPGNQHNPGGYYENAQFNNMFKGQYGKDWATGAFPEEHKDWNKMVQNALTREGYIKGPWFVKCGAFYWKIWKSFDPIYVKVWRSYYSIRTSYLRTHMLNQFTDEEIKTIIQRQLTEMENIPGLDVHIGGVKK